MHRTVWQCSRQCTTQANIVNNGSGYLYTTHSTDKLLINNYYSLLLMTLLYMYNELVSSKTISFCLSRSSVTGSLEICRSRYRFYCLGLVPWCWRLLYRSRSHAYCLDLVPWCWRLLSRSRSHAYCLGVVPWCWRLLFRSRSHAYCLGLVPWCWRLLSRSRSHAYCLGLVPWCWRLLSRSWSRFHAYCLGLVPWCWRLLSRSRSCLLSRSHALVLKVAVHVYYTQSTSVISKVSKIKQTWICIAHYA